MGGRVYDPIHDVFQDTEPIQDETAGTPSLEMNNTNNTEPLSTVSTATAGPDIDHVSESKENSNVNNEEPEIDHISVSKESSNLNGTEPAIEPVIEAVPENIENGTVNNVDPDIELTTGDKENSTISNTEPVQLKDQDQDVETLTDSQNANNSNVANTPIVTKHRKFTTKFNRHVKKKDGDFLTRKELQYSFFRELLSDGREVFTNIFHKKFFNMLVPFRDLYDDKGHVQIMNVTDKEFDARRFFSHKKLTFSQLYVLCLATSSKSSKVLREKLLADHFMAFSTCMLALLVNVGRLNTTINFSPEMTSQLRIFHSIPCLQCASPDKKSLQDTPRLKSILRNLPLGNDAIDLEKMYKDRDDNDDTGHPTFNVINMIFSLCDNPTFIKELLFKKEYFCGDLVDLNDEPHLPPPQGGEQEHEQDDENNEGELSIYTFLDSSKYTIKCRVTIILWILYILLETNLTERSILNSLKLFGENIGDGKYKIRLKLDKNGRDPDNHDMDQRSEVKYGNMLRERRKLFLEKKNIIIKDDSIGMNPSQESSPGVGAGAGAGNISVSDVVTPPVKKRRRRRKNILEIKDESSQDVVTNSNEDEDDVITIPLDDDKEDENKGVHKFATFLPMSTPDGIDIKQMNSKNRINVNTPDDPHYCEINNLIKEDKSRKIIGIKTQSEINKELIPIHEILRQRRQEIGIIKLFNEYENIPIAPALGVRGKKRKRYDDGYMGFETDYLKMFAQCKQLLLQNDITSEDFADSETTFRL